MSTVQTTLNGIDVEALKTTLEMIKDEPALARQQLRCQNTWINGSHNRSTIQGFYAGGQEDTTRTKPFVLDNDSAALGEDKGANPLEHLLNALAGCMTTTFVCHAAARGVELQSVETTLEGDLDLHGFLGLSEGVRNGYEGIRVIFHVKSDEPRETIEELIQLVQKRSPVYDIVTNPVPVAVRLAIVK